MNPLTLLEADNLTLLKGSSLLLRHYSLTIAAGQILHLTGDNGSGKTTLRQRHPHPRIAVYESGLNLIDLY